MGGFTLGTDQQSQSLPFHCRSYDKDGYRDSSYRDRDSYRSRDSYRDSSYKDDYHREKRL
jgi:hypothetical protein